MNVPVEKKWVGPAADKATVRLLAGGADAGKSVELNESNGWKASFEGLPKYDASGSEIEYTVAEDAVEGYDSAITGDAQGGFAVTNTSTAKVDVPVVKNGSARPPTKATVRLLAGGADAGKSVELNESNGWKAPSRGLPSTTPPARKSNTPWPRTRSRATRPTSPATRRAASPSPTPARQP